MTDLEELEKLSTKELEDLQYKVSFTLIKKIYNVRVISNPDFWSSS
jgi:hypothetical protein